MYPVALGIQLTRAPGRRAWGVSFPSLEKYVKDTRMAELPSPIQFEDIPIHEARRMGRGPRMDPQLYQELKTRIPALSSHAVHMTIHEGTSPTTMKNRILRMATARNPGDDQKSSGRPALLALHRRGCPAGQRGSGAVWDRPARTATSHRKTRAGITQRTIRRIPQP
jgi:hypothetical protein